MLLTCEELNLIPDVHPCTKIIEAAIIKTKAFQCLFSIFLSHKKDVGTVH